MNSPVFPDSDPSTGTSSADGLIDPSSLVEDSLDFLRELGVEVLPVDEDPTVKEVAVEASTNGYVAVDTEQTEATDGSFSGWVAHMAGVAGARAAEQVSVDAAVKQQEEFVETSLKPELSAKSLTLLSDIFGNEGAIKKLDRAGRIEDILLIAQIVLEKRPSRRRANSPDDRQVQVLKMRLRETPYSEIADALDINITSIHNDLAQIKRKLGILSPPEYAAVLSIAADSSLTGAERKEKYETQLGKLVEKAAKANRRDRSTGIGGMQSPKFKILGPEERRANTEQFSSTIIAATFEETEASALLAQEKQDAVIEALRAIVLRYKTLKTTPAMRKNRAHLFELQADGFPEAQAMAYVRGKPETNRQIINDVFETISMNLRQQLAALILDESLDHEQKKYRYEQLIEKIAGPEALFTGSHDHVKDYVRKSEKKYKDLPRLSVQERRIVRSLRVNRSGAMFHDPAIDGIQGYLNTIGQFPLLAGIEEEVALSKLVQLGNAMQDQIVFDGYEPTPEERREMRLYADARQAMISANLRLVVSVAKRYPVSTTMELLDIIQEGNLGLEHAVDKYDWRKGYKFSTYATFWIRQAIGRGLDQKSNFIRLPSDRAAALRAGLREVSGAVEELDDDLAGLYRIATTNSLDRKVGDADTSEFVELLADDAPSPEEIALGRAEERMVMGLLDVLDQRARHAVEERFGLNDGRKKSYREIGETLGVTSEAARRLIIRAVLSIRNQARDVDLRDFDL